MSTNCKTVSLRTRKIKNGEQLSFYLDYYPGYRDESTMKTMRHESLGIYIYAKPKNQRERDYNERTIYGHLAHYVAEGTLPVSDFVSSSKCGAIREVVSRIGTLSGLAPIKEACPDNITYEEIKMVIASMEAE